MFLLGLAFGSFLNVCIHRLPHELSVVWPGSACPNCKHPIRWHDNIPVLSWILLRGRCRDCRNPISARYLVVELLTAVLFAVVILMFGVTLEGLKYAVLAFVLLGLIFTDLDCKLLPDEFTLVGLMLGIAFSLVVPVDRFVSLFVPPLWWAHLPLGLAWRAASLLDSVSGALFGSMMIYGAGYLYLKARGVEGMGFGDVKMMAMIGAFLGIQMTLFTIGGAALAASLFGAGTIIVVWMKRFHRRRKQGREPAGKALRRAWRSASLIYRSYEIPFGTFLGAIAIIAFLFGSDLLRWYMHKWSLHIY